MFNMRIILLCLICLCCIPGVTSAGTEAVRLGDPAVNRLPEVAVLFSVFTRQSDLDKVNPEMVSGIVLSQFPDLWNGEIALITGDTDQVILGVENPPDEAMKDEYLVDFGRDLDLRDRENLQQSSWVIVCGIRGPARDKSTAAAAAYLACAIAQRVEGTIMDPATLECFSTRAFHALRLGENAGQLRARLITRPGVVQDGVCRLASRGMHTVGLPDLVLMGVPQERLQEAHLLLIATALVLDQQVDTGTTESKLLIGAREIMQVARPGQRLPVEPDLESTLAVGLVVADRCEFDDRNRHLQLMNNEEPEQLPAQMLNRLFPIREPVFEYLKLTDLDDVARRARADIPDLVNRFQLKRKDEEFFLLIVPPVASEADTLVWVRVARMDNSQRLSGVVMPDQMVRTLRTGDTVEFNAMSVFDWMVLKRGKPAGGNYMQQYLQELKKKSR